MKNISEKDAIKLLRKHANNEDSFNAILNHSKAVQKIALDIGGKVEDVDLDFIKTASLLHDIGRFKSGIKGKDVIKHGIFGGEILRKEGLFDHALAAERHMGAGISKEDIIEQGLELPLLDYIPISKEEKIIAHADNLVEDYRPISVPKAIERYEKELGKKAANKIKKLAEEVGGMRKDKS